MQTTDLLNKVSRAVRWHRRPLAALLAAVAVLAGLASLSPPQAPTQSVLVAAAELPGGHVLTAKDLLPGYFPEGLAPQHAATASSELIGKMLAAPITRGTPFTRASTVSASLSPGRGEQLVPFRVADASALSLVQVGDRVTVVNGGTDGQVITLASRVRVAALPNPEAGGTGLSGQSSAGLVVVSAPPEVASRLAAFATGQGLGITLG
ncbi:SAF domain-containing protein [Luteococcus sp. H138]|uniref:SAF domain-containing protein n=1 Tax=unclassified Luteococcus TaxID=2639923 RepID=UPI00313EC2B9